MSCQNMPYNAAPPVPPYAYPPQIPQGAPVYPYEHPMNQMPSAYSPPSCSGPPQMMNLPPPPQMNSCAMPPNMPPQSRMNTGIAETSQWMNNHFMNPCSPAPSATPSMMSMSHMSVPDDRFSEMSIRSAEMHGPPDASRLTELRSCSQISHNSCAENIDPCAGPSYVPMSFPQIIESFHVPKLRMLIVEETFQRCKTLKKGVPSGANHQLIVKIIEAIHNWGFPPGHEVMDKLARSLFFLCKYLPAEEVCRAIQMTNDHMLVIMTKLAVFSNAALLALVHMIEWKSKEGIEIRRWCCSHMVLDVFMGRLTQPDATNYGFYVFVIEGLKQICRQFIVAKQYVLQWEPKTPNYNGPRGIVDAIFRVSLPFCSSILQSNLKDAEAFYKENLQKIFALLYTVLMKNDNRQTTLIDTNLVKKIIEEGGIQIICRYMSGNCSVAMMYAMELLVFFSNVDFAETINRLPAESVQLIIQNVLRALNNVSSSSKEAVMWEKAFAFFVNFISNRPYNKGVLIHCNGIAAIIYALKRFSSFDLPERSAANYVILNELADNAVLCLITLLTEQHLDMELIKRRDSQIDHELLRCLLNLICQADIYVQKRVLRLLQHISVNIPIYCCDDYLLKVLDEKNNQNLLTSLYRIVSMAPKQLNVLANMQKPSNKDLERRKYVPEVIYRTIALLTYYLKNCQPLVFDYIVNLIKNESAPVMDLMRTYHQESNLCGNILSFCNEACRDEVVMQQWLNEKPVFDSLATSSDPRIAQPAQQLVDRMTMLSDIEPMVGMFSAVGNVGYLD